jgi:hypothetical protein
MLLFVLGNFHHDGLTPAQRDGKPAFAQRQRIAAEDFGPPAMQGGNSFRFAACKTFEIAKIRDKTWRNPEFRGPKPKERFEQVQSGR